MTNRIDHTDCLHEATAKDRAACRKDRASAAAALEVLILALFDAMPATGEIRDWLTYGASCFGDTYTSDRREAALALLAYFGPSGDEDRDASRRRNGYLVTTDAYEIRRTILRRAS